MITVRLRAVCVSVGCLLAIGGCAGMQDSIDVPEMSRCDAEPAPSGSGTSMRAAVVTDMSDRLIVEVFVEEDLAAALTAGDAATAPRIEFASSAEGAMPQTLDPANREPDSSEGNLRFRVNSDGTDLARSGWTVTLIDPVSGDTLAECRLAPE